ncbi:MAG TPA: phosphoribosyltransferase family protein [Chryseolinea sp.]|nr:phosphoribosyltransferase family protein [Chryseolinea sp.]
MEIIDKDRIFKDRTDAGIELGKILERKYKDRKALVLGIPRGGVVVAHQVAKILNGELSVVITKKLPHPLQEELAIGAAAEDGSFYLTSLGKRMDIKAVQSILLAQEKEIQSRIGRFRKGKSLPEMKNRIVILTDDGIATGSTIVPAIQLCKKRNAEMVIVAAPVSGEQYVSEIDELADEVVIAEQPEMFYAVGQVYEDFHHLSDEEVIQLLEDSPKTRKTMR